MGRLIPIPKPLMHFFSLGACEGKYFSMWGVGETEVFQSSAQGATPCNSQPTEPESKAWAWPGDALLLRSLYRATKIPLRYLRLPEANSIMLRGREGLGVSHESPAYSEAISTTPGNIGG